MAPDLDPLALLRSFRAAEIARAFGGGGATPVPRATPSSA